MTSTYVNYGPENVKYVYFNKTSKMTGKNCSQSVNFCCKKTVFNTLHADNLFKSLTALEAEIFRFVIMHYA